MSDHSDSPTTETLLHDATRAAAFGAVVGGMAALPAVYDGLRTGSVSREDAAHRVLRAGAHVAVATGVGTAAAALVGHNRMLRLAALLLAGGATLHALAGPAAAARPAPISAPEV